MKSADARDRGGQRSSSVRCTAIREGGPGLVVDFNAIPCSPESEPAMLDTERRYAAWLEICVCVRIRHYARMDLDIPKSGAKSYIQRACGGIKH